MNVPRRADRIEHAADPWLDQGNQAVRELHLEPLVAWLQQRWPGGARVIDYGCGDGMLASMLGDRWQVVGYDPSPAARRAAEARGIAVHDTLDGVAGVAPVDAVVLASVVQYLADPTEVAGVMARAAGWLGDGGSVVVTDMVTATSSRWHDVVDLVRSTSARFGVPAAFVHLVRTARRSHAPLLVVDTSALGSALEAEGLAVRALDRNLSTFRTRSTIEVSRV